MAQILLVEDDIDQSEQYSTFLRSNDGGSHIVETAQSATTAVKMASKKRYDLVLLDIMMSYFPEDEANEEIDDHKVDYGRKMGLYVYSKICELPTSPPIALISVVRESTILAEFPLVVGYLSKYFTLEDLRKSVLQWLKLR